MEVFNQSWHIACHRRNAKLEMRKSIGIGKYRLKTLVSVSVQINFQVPVSVEFLGIGIGIFNLYQIATENKKIKLLDS